MLPCGQVGRPKEVNPLVREAGGRPYSSKTLNAPGFHTDFFEQLPFCTYPRILAGVQSSGGNLEQVVERRVAILFNEEDRRVGAARIGRKRDYRGGAGVADHLELSDRAVRESDGIDIEVDDLPGMNPLARQCWNSHVNGTLNPSANR